MRATCVERDNLYNVPFTVKKDWLFRGFVGDEMPSFVGI